MVRPSLLARYSIIALSHIPLESENKEVFSFLSNHIENCLLYSPNCSDVTNLYILFSPQLSNSCISVGTSTAVHSGWNLAVHSGRWYLCNHLGRLSATQSGLTSKILAHCSSVNSDIFILILL